ncbi:RICIN domain-containing protein, partial [Chloroflexota bacterium]
DLKADGNPTSWSSKFTKGGLGYYNAGGGTAIADINDNGTPDLLLMGVDDPEKGKSNSFWYYIGWDLKADGNPTSWSSKFTKGGLGTYTAGGGTAIADINGNGKPDLLLMGADDPGGGNSFWYYIGWDLKDDGNPTSWSPMMSQGGLGYHNAGGGAAIADINGDGKLDMLLTGVDNPKKSNSFWYYVGWDIEPETKTLARYKEDFMLTGFAVEENFGCDAGLFYSDDANQTVRAYSALRYEFLNSNNTVSQADASLPEYDITVTSDVRQFAHVDAALKELTGSMIADALDSLPSGKKLPIAFAMEDTSVTAGMDSLVSSSYILGDSYHIDLTDVPQITWKSIKLPWYNTTTGELLEYTELLSEVISWDWSTDEKVNVLTILLAWSLGETSMTRMGGNELLQDTPEKGEVLNKITETHDLLEWVRRNITFPLHTSLHTSLLLGIAGPMVPVIIAKGRQVLITWRMLGAAEAPDRLRVTFCTALHSSDYANTFNPLRRAVRKLPTTLGSDVRPVNRWFSVSNARYVRFLRVLGKVLIVASVLAIIGEFLYIAWKEGWTGFGFAVAGMYAVMEVIYLGILVAIACIPVVGWVIDIAILIADIVASCYGYGSGWVMGKIVDAFVDYDLRSNVNLETRDSSVNVEDYDDNGLTVGDRIELRSRIIEKVSKTSDGSNQDVRESYITPHYSYSVSDDSEAGWFRNTASSSEHGSWREVEHDTGVWVKPAKAMVNFPLTVWLEARYKVFYDKCIVVTCSRESTSDSSASASSTLYFDVLPGNLDDFLNWEAISAQDKDSDGLADSVEGYQDDITYYRTVNKVNGLSLDAAALQSNVQVFPYEGQEDQKWRLAPDLEDNAVALKAWNAKYVGTQSDKLVATVDNYKQSEERFNIIDLGNNTVALKASNGKYVSADLAAYPGELVAVVDEIKAKEKFQILYQEDGTVAFKAWNEKYVSADLAAYPGKLMAIADQILGEEKFQITSSGYYQIYAKSSGGCLSISDGSDNEGASVVTKPYYGRHDDQRWYLKPMEGGYYRIVAGHSGKVLGIDGDAHSGANVVQEAYTGADDQKWRLEPVESATGPSKWDSDADGLSDGFEARSFVDLGTDPTKADSDGDGLNDKLELEIGTSPAVKDTDSDGLSDYEENRGWLVSFIYYGQSFTEHVWPDPLMVDSDGDGLTDYEEHQKELNPRSKDTDGDGVGDGDDNEGLLLPLVFALNPASTDTDGDGLTDPTEATGWDITFTSTSGTQTIHVTSDPWLADTDFDGLSDYQEFNLSHPRDIDTDGDGLNDFAERERGTLITWCDTDLDGLDDGTEIGFGSDPLKADTDGDGLSDLEEFNLGSDPTRPDTDGDGLTDFQEVGFFSSLTSPDSDEDLLFDSQEYALGTDPGSVDSDLDGVSDGYEAIIGTDPLSMDSDGDGIQDQDELELWTDPLQADSDGDGLTDFQEVQYGTNPLSQDSDADGIDDASDQDTAAPNVDEVFVLYDEGAGDYSQFIAGLSQYTEVTAGTLADIPDYQEKPYLILLGYPSAEEGTVGNITYGLLSEDSEIMERMLASDLYRFVRGGDIWPNNKLIIMLTQPYHSDHWRVLSMIKNLKVNITENSISLTYPEAKDFFFLEAIKEI